MLTPRASDPRAPQPGRALLVPAASPGNFRVTAALHPLKVEARQLELPEGLTVRQLLEASGADPLLIEHCLVFIGGEAIPRAWWDRVRPKAGALVEVRAFPAPGKGGGGKNPLRIVLMIAVIAASFYFGPALGGFLFGGQFGLVGGSIAIGGVAVSTAALGSAIIGMAGMLLVNAIAPVRPPKLEQLSSSGGRDSPTLFIEGARNQARPFAPVPVVLGRHRVYPSFGAAPFTETVGDKQFLRLLFVWGVGPLAIDTASLKIGETPLTDFEGVTVEHREGYPDDADLTLYTQQVDQQNFTILLSQAAGWVTRSAGANADELSIDLTFPGGLAQFDSQGKRQPRSVTVEIQYRLIGESAWSNIDTSDARFQATVPVAWLDTNVSDELTRINFTHNKTAAIRHGIRWAVASRGDYEVTIRRTSADTTSDQIIDEVQWSALRAITDEDPIDSPVPLTKTALAIQATDQLNSVIDEFNGVVTSVALDWDNSTGVSTGIPGTGTGGDEGGVWIERATQAPAALFRHVLQGNGIAAPLPDARIDLETLQEWHEFCAARGLRFNMVRDFRGSVWETLADIAAAGRAAPVLLDGKWSVVIERPQSVPVSHITPRNSFDFRAEKAFPERPHAWRIRFPNENEGWRQDERRVYRDGFAAETDAELGVVGATKFESLELPGVTDPDQIQTGGRFRIAQGLLQPERWSFQQDMEYLTYRRGDRVAVTHDVLLVGLASGRVKAVTLDSGGEVVGLTLDEPVTMEAGKDYGIALRTPADGQIVARVVTAAGTTQEIALAPGIPPRSDGSAAVARGDLFGFGLRGQETDDASIVAIAPANDFRARVIAVPYRDAIFDADSESIPPFATNLTPLPVIPAPAIRGVTSDESALAVGPGESLRCRIAVAFDPLDDPRLNEPRLEVQMRPTETGEPYFAAPIDAVESGRVLVAGVRDDETWDLRLRFVVAGRLPGPWAIVNSHRVIGKSTLPAGLTGFTLSAFGGQALLRWDRPDELDVIFGGEVRFRHSALLEGATWEGSVSIGEVARARTLFATVPLKPGTYFARVSDVEGSVSTNIASVTTKQASVLAFAAVDSLDEAPDFLGVADDVTVDGLNNLTLETDVDGEVLAEGTYLFATGFDFGSTAGDTRRVRLTTRLTVAISNVLDQIDDRTDLIDDWEDFDGVSGAPADCRVFVRHSDDDPASSAAAWSEWQRLDSAEFEARGFEFKAELTSTDVSYNILVSELGVDAEEVA